MRTFFLATLTSFSAAVSTFAQMPPPPVSMGGSNGTTVIAEAAKPVIVNGKRATDLTDDELTEFLQSKIQTIEQGDGELALLRVAPGYVLTIAFDEPVASVIMGDPSLASYERTGKTLLLSAKHRAGDTNFKVLFSGGVMREYHLFVEPNYVSAMSTLRVKTPKKWGASGSEQGGGAYVEANGTFNIKAILNVVNNYDALVSERAVDTHRIKRTNVFREGAAGSFTYYYTFAFPDNVRAVSFSYRNSASHGALDPSRVRLQIGEVSFRPDFVSFDRNSLRRGETTSGLLIFNNPAFSLNQPFEITHR